MSFDSVDENRAFAEKFDFPFRLLCDTDKQLSIAFGAADADSKYPSRYTFVIDPDGLIAHAIDTSDPAGQADALLARL